MPAIMGRTSSCREVIFRPRIGTAKAKNAGVPLQSDAAIFILPDKMAPGCLHLQFVWVDSCFCFSWL